MVDRNRRDQFAQHLRHFAAGLMTNDQFEDRLECEILPDGPVKRWPEPFLWSMFGMAWTLYSDTRMYRLRGDDALSREERRMVARWILFLYSTREYELPLFDPFSPLGCLLNLLTLGWADRWGGTKFGREVDLDLWPYARREDLDADCRNPRLLCGRR
jgi:hypothetical protein